MRQTTPHRKKAKTILVASIDLALLQWKKEVLERAGYVVVVASSIDEVSRTCQTRKIDLLLLGSALSPAEKRKFWVEARNSCRSPVLELYSTGDPELMDESRTHIHHLSRTSSDLVNAVQAILESQ